MPVTEQPIDQINRASFPLSRLADTGHNMFSSGLVKEPHAGRPTPKHPIAGQLRDVDGDCWNIRDVRTTKHGFDLFCLIDPNMVMRNPPFPDELVKLLLVKSD